jgi:signal transduction histidine kinase
MTPPSMTAAAPPTRWQRIKTASVLGFHAYANWLVGISWKRFALLALLLLVFAGVLKDLPPFSWTYTRTINVPADVVDLPDPPELPAPPPPPKPAVRIDKPASGTKANGVEIVIDERGVRISPRAAAAASGASAASAPEAAASGAPLVEIKLPPGATSEAVRGAVEEARQAIEEAVEEARVEAEAAREEARQAGRDAAREARRAAAEARKARRTVETHEVSMGEFLPSLAFLWIVASLVIKITYRKQIQAEAQAAQAVETAEAESLKRQVVEARMAAMQAQVEPHFLFNTLASIDHLIEVDPKRASQMQKNLIALLRASMPTMRETGSEGSRPRDLGRELAVIRPYLEILKVRMEERLATEIDVPDGLLSAEFPAMMVQTLVENAIKHGLEPKPEGGKLSLKAEVVHGKLTVTVADTGLGFGRAATAGTGVGLANIRERLQLLYGPKANLTITENPGGGTRVVLAVPYKPLEGA